MTKKRVGSFVIALAMMFTIISATDFGVRVNAADGISDEAELKDIGTNLSGSYILDADITLTDPWDALSEFTGTLDGAGHVISGLTNANGEGLFESLSDTAVVKNLGFNNAKISGSFIGVVTGSEPSPSPGIITADGYHATVSSCYAINSTVAGIAGQELLGNAPNTAIADYFFGKANETGITGTTKIVELVESTTIPGEFSVEEYTRPEFNGNSGTSYTISSATDLTEVSRLVNDGIGNFAAANTVYTLSTSITLDGKFRPIGNDADLLVRAFKGTFNGNNKKISGTIYANGAGDAGIFGTTSGAVISDLGLDVTTSNGTRNVGALIGTARGGEKISNCYSKNTISGTGNVGGLIGETVASTAITNCYSTIPAPTGTTTVGLVGESTSSTTINNCYTTANRFVGTGTITPTNSFYVGTANGTNTRTLEEMKTPLFTNKLNDSTISAGIFGTAVGSTPVIIKSSDAGTATTPCQLIFTKPTGGALEVRNTASGTLVTTGTYFVKDTILTVKAIPENGYELSSLTANGVSVVSGGTFSMGSNPVTLAAEFTKYASYTITVVKNDGGTVTPSDSAVLVKQNTAQVFTIIPNEDCTIKSVTYTGNGLTIDGDTYTTGNVSKNETLTVKFVSKSDGVKSTTVTDDGKVITVKTVDDIIDQINDDNIGSTIKVSVDNPIISRKILSALEDYNINVVLTMGLYSWRINGRSISDTDSSINLGTNISASAIDSAYMSQFVNYKDKTQLDLTYTGEFPFTGYLTFEAPGSDSIGKYANLFYFNEMTKTFEAMDSVKVDDDGNVTFKFNHASKYVVAVSSAPMTAQDLSVGAGKTDKSMPISKTTTDILFASILLLVVVAGGIALMKVIRRAK